MGNALKYFESQSLHLDSLKFDMPDKFVPVNKFQFMSPFEDDSTNGLYFNDIYLPEEIIANILSHVPPKDVLKLTRVCKKWCNIVKSENFWMHVYNRHHSKAKKLPWYVYYCYFTTNNFENLLKNGNGQEQYKHWKIIKNFGDKFTIEDPPTGADPLPLGVPDFNGHTSCFATSFQDCNKIQIISLKNKRLLRYILNKFNPHIYASEWVTGRFDCGCTYRLVLKGYKESFNEEELDDFSDEEDESNTNALFYLATGTNVEQWQGRQWEKVEVLVKEYPPDVAVLIFEHEGSDTQFWKGHYGSKMAGGVVKIVFDSIHPSEDELGTNLSQSDENSKMDM
uniref:F-box only protein n=1 Tax=Anoplophora glabripennis TaxID=217634 RepID=V5GSZ5_ANOGL